MSDEIERLRKENAALKKSLFEEDSTNMESSKIVDDSKDPGIVVSKESKYTTFPDYSSKVVGHKRPLVCYVCRRIIPEKLEGGDSND